MVQYTETTWQQTDGQALFACSWLPEQDKPVRGTIGIIHGMGEHIGRYAHVAEYYAAAGFAVFGYDHRGHGRTAGQRGHTPSYDSLLEGVDSVVATMRQAFPEAPAFLYGHSMGGNVTLNYLLRRKPDLAGAVISAPWLALAFKPPALQEAVGRLLESIYPAYSSNQPLNPLHLTSDLDMVERHKRDLLIHGRITAGFYGGIRRSGEWALQHAHELTVPILLMHSSADQITSFQASKQFADAAGSLCEWKEWSGFRHELHNDSGREQALQFTTDWIASHAGQTSIR